MIAPSTSMPTVSTSPNITIMLTVIPSPESVRKPRRIEVGIAMPTRSAERKPSAATITIITRTMAVAMDASKLPNTSKMNEDWSSRKSILTVDGQSDVASATTARTASLFSMMFSPMRLTTLMVIAGAPLTRVNVVGSLNERRTSAMSRTVTTVSPLAFSTIV